MNYDPTPETFPPSPGQMRKALTVLAIEAIRFDRRRQALHRQEIVKSVTERVLGPAVVEFGGQKWEVPESKIIEE